MPQSCSSLGYACVMWEGCGRQKQKERVDRQASCPEVLGTDIGARKADIKGTGKRFARRAKRWAELQQRRQNARQQHRFDAEVPPRAQFFYDIIDSQQTNVTIPTGVLCAPGHSSLSGRRSLPFSIIHQHNSEQFRTSAHDLPSPVFHRNSPNSTYFSFSGNKLSHSNSEFFHYSRSNEDAEVCMLVSDVSQMTLGFTGSNSPLSTSVSSRTSDSDQDSSGSPTVFNLMGGGPVRTGYLRPLDAKAGADYERATRKCFSFIIIFFLFYF